MTRDKIIEHIKVYFKIEELVSREVYSAYRNDSWALLDTETLHCLLIIRAGIDKPITVNNWLWDGTFDERGFRENTCDICKKKTKKGKLYTSGHVLGKAFDFHIDGVSSDLVRKWIKDNADLFPCKIRLENKLNGTPISWVHFDTKYYERNAKVHFFNV